MSFLVFVEDIFAPEVTAVTLKTWNFFSHLSFNGIFSGLKKSNRECHQLRA